MSKLRSIASGLLFISSLVLAAFAACIDPIVAFATYVAITGVAIAAKYTKGA